MITLNEKAPPQPIASAFALLLSLAVLALATAGFAKVDDQLGLFASGGHKGIITIEVLNN